MTYLTILHAGDVASEEALGLTIFWSAWFTFFFFFFALVGYICYSLGLWYIFKNKTPHLNINPGYAFVPFYRRFKECEMTFSDGNSLLAWLLFIPGVAQVFDVVIGWVQARERFKLSLGLSILHAVLRPYSFLIFLDKGVKYYDDRNSKVGQS